MPDLTFVCLKNHQDFTEESYHYNIHSDKIGYLDFFIKMKPVFRRRFTMRILRIALVVVRCDNKVLLGFSKREFNKDKYCLLGGVLQSKEDIQACAIKNVKIQSGINVEKLEKVGKIEVKFAGVQELLQFHVYFADSYTGELKESRELNPEWFPISDLPYEQMWQDISIWLPYVLNGKKVKGFFIYQNEDLVYQDLNTDATFGPRAIRSNSNSVSSPA